VRRFTDYHEAFDHAAALARSTNLDIAIRRVREFGKDGFNVSYAAWNDSDYALAEIVRPADAVTVARRTQAQVVALVRSAAATA
jgi:hypothetical protein